MKEDPTWRYWAYTKMYSKDLVKASGRKLAAGGLLKDEYINKWKLHLYKNDYRLKD